MDALAQEAAPAQSGLATVPIRGSVAGPPPDLPGLARSQGGVGAAHMMLLVCAGFLAISSLVGLMFVLVRKVPTRVYWIAVVITFPGIAYFGLIQMREINSWMIPILLAAPLFLPVPISRIRDIRNDSWATFWFTSIAFGLTLFLALELFGLIGLSSTAA